MMREAYIPYTKLVNVTNNTAAVTVNLTDSEGTALECNYVQVAAAVSSTDGYFYVTPNVTSAKGFASADIAAEIPNNDASGAVGMVSNRETGVAVISLPPGDKTSSIKISHSENDSVTYAVTYGNVRLANTQRDNTLKRGN